MSYPQTIEVFVKSVTFQAQGIHAWELRPVGGDPLPAFTAGAHIDLHLANGMVRSYSLCNSQEERHRYVVAIARDAMSRGGSAFIHETLKPGDRLAIGPPRNHFALDERAQHSVFIAGGIGITPIYAMIQRVKALGNSWELHYSARLSTLCAFREELGVLGAGQENRVSFNFDHEPDARPTDLVALVAALPDGAHVYCCGPNPMLTAFEDATKAAGLPPARVHVEYFKPKQEAAVEGGFLVELARTGRIVSVPHGESILQALLDEGIDAPHSCFQGVCGTCEVRVLEGVPDHRDSVLGEDERATNQTMMICCSGSKGPKLVIDL